MSRAKPAVPMQKQYITRREVAAYLGCSLTSVRGLIRDGQIPEFRPLPHAVRYRLEDVEAFMQSRRKVAA